MADILPESLKNVRSLTFDLMGTCTDWHTSIVQLFKSLPSAGELDLSALANDWRSGFFQAIFDSFNRGEQSPDIDNVHRQVLDRLLAERGIEERVWGEDARRKLVRGWHCQLGTYSIV